MKNILNAPFVQEMKEATANMYRLGWDERNGGNISYLLEESEVAEYLDLNNVIRTIPTGFDASALIGKIFIVTGTGKYFKNVEKDPETNLGIVRIAKDGTTAELLWGYKDGGKFTSEFPAHMMSHISRLAIDKNHRMKRPDAFGFTPQKIKKALQSSRAPKKASTAFTIRQCIIIAVLFGLGTGYSPAAVLVDKRLL